VHIIYPAKTYYIIFNNLLWILPLVATIKSDEKFHAFGWHVLEINGNDIRAVYDAVFQARAIFEKPVCIIAYTIPGKGVDFMEQDFNWHGKPPNKEEGEKALRQLRTLGGKISGE